MAGSLAAFGTAFAITFLAEFADKTQLALVALAARGSALRVWLGAALAFLLLSIVAVAAGGLLGAVLPPRVVAAGAGVLFILFGVLALAGKEEENANAARSGFWQAFALMLVAEAGDKTQLALAALAAAGQPPVATALGGWVALSAAGAIAVGLGGILQRRVGAHVVRRAAAVVFIAAGLFFLARAAWPSLLS